MYVNVQFGQYWRRNEDKLGLDVLMVTAYINHTDAEEGDENVYLTSLRSGDTHLVSRGTLKWCYQKCDENGCKLCEVYPPAEKDVNVPMVKLGQYWRSKVHNHDEVYKEPYVVSVTSIHSLDGETFVTLFSGQGGGYLVQLVDLSEYYERCDENGFLFCDV